MFDGYTSTRGEPGPGLTLDELLRVWRELEAKLPRLLYHTSDSMPVIDKDGEPMIVRVTPTDTFTGLFEEYVVVHPDNLSYLKKVCRGLYRLDPTDAA